MQYRTTLVNLSCLKLVLSCLLLTSFSLSSLAESTTEQRAFEIDLIETEQFDLRAPIYTVFNHNTATWDPQKRTEEGTRKLIEWSGRNSISTLMTVHSEAVEDEFKGSKYFIDSRDVHLTVQSEEGAHKLRMFNAQTVLFSGGNLEYCLCEFFRDTLIYAGFKNQLLNIVFVKDAVYTDGSRGNYTSKRSGNTLADYLNDEGPESTSDYFLRRVLKQNTGFCGYVNSAIKYYSFKIIIDGKLISAVGRGAKQVNILLADINDLKAVERVMTAKEIAADPNQFFMSLINYQQKSREDPVPDLTTEL